MFFKVKKLCKSYDNKSILNDINLEINRGELISIIGPSGVGKTTLLKIIAKLENADSGSIEYENADFKTNPVIMVFQDYVLFPNLTVFKNIAFGLENKKIKRDEIKEKVNKILIDFQLEDKAKNYPNQLSAGQKQRVAIARAIVINPSILLLDEPFANLDKNLKSETADFIKSAQKKFDITTIAVTHDQQEAFMISDKIGILLNGELKQFDTVNNIYHNPVSIEVAKFLGHVNIIPSKLYNTLSIKKDQINKTDTFFARAESFTIEKDNKGNGIIEDVCFAGHFILYRVKLEDISISVYKISNNLHPGDRVTVKIRPQN